MRAPTSIAALALAVLLLSGCLPQQSAVTPTPEPSSTPVFASEEEALAAATAAYAAYLAVSDQIGADGGADPERLEPLVTADRLPEDVAQFTEFAGSGRHLSGSTMFDSVLLQSFSEPEITIYLCIDVTEVRILDVTDNDVTPVDRPNRIPLEVGFETAGNSNELLLASSDVWGGDLFCNA